LPNIRKPRQQGLIVPVEITFTTTAKSSKKAAKVERKKRKEKENRN
jgi:hypothetical protein